MSITYKIEISNRKIENISNFTEEIFNEMMEMGKIIVREQLERLDDELMQSRDSKRYRNKGKRKTAIKCKLGVVEYTRRIYFDTVTKQHVFLFDKMLSPHSVGLYDDKICGNIKEMICNQTFREVAHSISETTGLEITQQAVWSIVQKLGEQEIALSTSPDMSGEVESKILYEEADGDWLKLQGDDRKEYGQSKEMKIGIAYDGVLQHPQKDGKTRYELDNKVAYASFESASDFNKHKENMISRVYNTDEIELRIRNGDGANWIQKAPDCDCICVLDEFHRNKKITECVSDKNAAENLRTLLLSNKFDELLECIEAYINSTEDEHERAKLTELYSYYFENKEALAGYYDRGIEIPPTRDKNIHHARLGSMEGNVFTIIGNRMKGRRACWSIKGGNNLAALLCSYYTNAPLNSKPKDEMTAPVLSAAKVPETIGKGYEYARNISIPSNLRWLKSISAYKPLSNLPF